MMHNETGEQVKLLDLPKDPGLPVIKEHEPSGNDLFLCFQTFLSDSMAFQTLLF